MKVRLAGIRPVTKIRGTQGREEILKAAVVLVEARGSQLQKVTQQRGNEAIADMESDTMAGRRMENNVSMFLIFI